jgi:hypothetical protein
MEAKFSLSIRSIQSVKSEIPATVIAEKTGRSPEVPHNIFNNK